MKLKKNDKIILIVGVVILIAAGAGIALYTVDTSDDDISLEEVSDAFSYSWMEKTADLNLGSSLEASTAVPYEAMITISSPANTVLTEIALEISWEDDGVYGLRNNRGLDTLYAEVSQGSVSESMTSVGSGNETMVFSIYDRPMDDSVEAESQSEAIDIVDDLIQDYNEADFDFMVTIDPGEKIWRPLKWFRDKGDDFSLTAHLTYYTYEFDDMNNINNNDDDSDDDIVETSYEDFGHNIGEFYINLGYGRGMI